MVTQQTIDVILRAKDQLTQTVDKVNQKLGQTGSKAKNAMNETKNATSQATTAMKQQETGVNTLGSKYDQFKNKVTNAFRSVKNTLQSSVTNVIKESSLTSPFLNAAEKIKQKWQSTMQQIKSATGVLSNMRIGTGEISNAGLATLNGQIATTTSKTSLLSTALIKVGGAVNTIGTKAQTAFTSFKTHLTSAKDKLTNLASGLSGVQGAIMSAFAIVGVTSLKSFIIDSAIAREKVNAVTKEVAGSEAAFKKANKSIKDAVAGTTLGYNNMATAVNNVALRFHVTGDAVSSLAGPMSKVGILAQAMGKSSEEAASIMEHAFDGLQDKWRSLKQIGITKEDLIGAGWSGAADDVEGYARALDKVLEKNPQFKEFTQTFEYQWESFKMSIKGVGTEIGMVLLPILKSLLSWFSDLTKQHPWLLKVAVVIGLIVLALASIATVILPIIMLINAIKEITIVTAIWNAVMAMNPITLVVMAIAALIAILTYLYFTNEDVRNALNGLWDFLVNSFIGAWEWLKATFQGLYDFLVGIFGPVWEWLCGVFQNGSNALNDFINWLQWLYEKFMEVLPLILAILMPWTLLFDENIRNTAIAAVQSFVEWISKLPGELWNWLMSCIENVKLWAIQLKDKMIEAAKNAVFNFIEWLKSLPGKAWEYLNQLLGKAGEFKDQIVKKLKEAGVKAVTYFTDKIKQLPVKMWEELMNVKSNIENSAGRLVEAIKNLGLNMLHGFLHALHIESPGYMAQAIEAEMGYIGTNMSDAYKDLYVASEEVGAKIIEGYNRNDFGSMITTLEDTLPKDIYGETNVDMKATTVTDNLSTGDVEAQAEGNLLLNSVVNTDMNSITSDMLNMTNTVNPQLLSVTNSLSTMGNTSTQTSQLSLKNNADILQSYNQMQTGINQSMNQIQQMNITGWNNVKQVTTNSLNSMLSSTKSVTSQMIAAWQTMKNSIIQAANDIKTQSESRFNSLWNTIKTFYNRIQHPGGAGGPTSGRSTGRGRNGFKSFSNALNNTIGGKSSTQTINRQALTHNGFSKVELEYLFPTANSRIGVKDLETYLEFMLQAGAGGWSSVVSPNVKWIRKTTNEWKTAPPTIIGKYETSKGFRVGDFENGEPEITFSDFKQLAEDVFSQIQYDFYWDSSKYGNWITAFHAGYMNCDDSTEALMAMARACGLSAQKVHGHWNQYGHYWANIAGHKMDTTGWMKRRDWTPAASHAGPVPKRLQTLSADVEDTDSIINILLDIKNLLTSKDEQQQAVTINHTGSVDYKFKHEIDDIPEGLTAEQVVNIMDAHVEDSSFLRAITSNREFQERFERVYNKIVRERERFA